MSMSLDRPASTPRLLATAVGVAITGMSAAQLAQADQTAPLSLGTTTVTGDAVDGDYKVDQAQSSKYTAPLRDTPRSVTVVPQQVLKDTNSLNLQDALRTVPGITMGAAKAVIPPGTVRSFAVLIPRAACTSTVCVTPALRAAKFSLSKR